ncbi:hypothetical protein R1flu_000805 [Riccia fluitans]|uniref:Uncharacterized protein n=1 Tax=Riccia fluitans TaxID=41844 RepID=A0ABD1Y1X2_9MARC
MKDVELSWRQKEQKGAMLCLTKTKGFLIGARWKAEVMEKRESEVMRRKCKSWVVMGTITRKSKGQSPGMEVKKVCGDQGNRWRSLNGLHRCTQI